MKKNTLKIVLAIYLSGLALSANATAYNFTDLGTLGGTSSTANAINNAGQVVGYAYTTGNAAQHATLWNGITATDLGTLGGTVSVANDINDAGQVVGYGYTAGDARQRAALWNGTTVTDLGTNFSNATAINNAGQIVVDGSVVIAGNGYNTQDSTAYRAMLLNGTTATDLGTLGGRSSHATAINNVGQVVGYGEVVVGDVANSNRRAALWNGTTITNLGKDSITFSTATAINNAGQVAGYSVIPGSMATHATIWNGTTTTDLGTLGGSVSFALAINDSSQIVGAANIAGDLIQHATLWNGNIATDLNSFLDASAVAAGWVLRDATGINDNGWIVGNVTNTITGVTHAYLLTAAVPEPDSYAMILMGLGLIGFEARRLKNGQA